MKDYSVMILKYHDLCEDAKKLDIASIETTHFKSDIYKQIIKSPFVVYIDNELNMKCIKDRYNVIDK